MEYSDQRNDLQRIEDDLMLLEMQVVASDPEAVDLAFRLLAKSDGHVAELLDQMLGRLTRVNPHLFLLAAQRHPEAINGGLVGNFGPAFVDRELAHAYERDQRVRSLLKVTDVSLKQVRDACIRLLQSD